MKYYENKNFIPFKEIKEHDWSDVVPIKQYDGEIPIMNFKYPDDCIIHSLISLNPYKTQRLSIILGQCLSPKKYLKESSG